MAQLRLLLLFVWCVLGGAAYGVPEPTPEALTEAAVHALDEHLDVAEEPTLAVLLQKVETEVCELAEEAPGGTEAELPQRRFDRPPARAPPVCGRCVQNPAPLVVLGTRGHPRRGPNERAPPALS